MKNLGRLLLAIAALVPMDTHAAPRAKEDSVAAALNDPARLVTIGDHGRASGDFMLALSFYERALSIDPRFLPALRAATEVALAIRLPQALSYAERWVSAKPQDGLAHLAVGAALVQQNRPSEAQKSFALSEAAGGPAAAIAVQRGLAFDLLGQNRNAQIAYAEALQRAPGDRSILEYMALSFAIGGDDAAALQLLQPEAEKASGEPSFERTLVLIHALSGRVDLARRIAATSLSPQASVGVGDLLQRVAMLPTPAAKAAAVHLGILPDAGVAAPPPQQVAEAPAIVQAEPQPRAEPIVPKPPAIESQRTPPVKKVAAPKPPALPKALPKLSAAALKAEHIWLQLSSSPDRAMLATDHAKFRKKARGTLDGYSAYLQDAKTTHRLLVGPFRSMADAQAVAKRLKTSGVSALPNRIAAGASITPL